jgi:hypothetical protein
MEKVFEGARFFSARLIRPLETLPTFDRPEIDSTKQQGKFVDGNLRARLSLFSIDQVSGKLKRSFLQPLVPDRQPVTVPIQDFDAVPIAVSKDEQVTAQRILLDDAGGHA